MARPPKAQNLKTYAGQVGARIRAARLRKKLSVADAAAAAGAPAPTWYHWEAGRHLPLDALPAIAEALGTSPRNLLPA